MAVRQSCRFCSDLAVRTLAAGKLQVPVCVRHDAFVRATGKELAGTAARGLGVYVQHKQPRVFEVAKMVYLAVRHGMASAQQEGGEE